MKRAGDRALSECSRGVLVGLAKNSVQSFERIVTLLEGAGDKDRSLVTEQFAVELYRGNFSMGTAMAMLEPQRHETILYSVYRKVKTQLKKKDSENGFPGLLESMVQNFSKKKTEALVKTQGLEIENLSENSNLKI